MSFPVRLNKSRSMIRCQKADVKSPAHPSFCLTLCTSFDSLALSLPIIIASLCPYLLVFLSQQLVPEDLSPALTDQVQLHSNRKVHHRLDSPARAERRSTSSRPSQVALGCGHWEALLFTHRYLHGLTSVFILKSVPV